tara:strand:- start:58 stop:1293 length:1236 start_codon:yes stop_codon:yes gene_type:complete
MEKIGLALAGFGAGYRGGGTEFLKMQQNKNTALSEERKTAAAQDLYKAHLMLDQEIKNANAGGGPINLGPLNAFAETRVGAINKLGGDPSDTMAEMASINNDPLAALEAQRQGLMMAQSQGYIALPANFGPAKPTPFQQNISGLSPEDQQAALRVEAGLQPVAVKKTLTPEQQNWQDYMPEGVTWTTATRKQKLAAKDASARYQTPADKINADILKITLENKQATADKLKTEAIEKAEGKNKKSVASVFESRTAIDNIDNVLLNDGYKEIYGLGDNFIPTIQANSVALEAQVNQVVSLLGLESRKKLVGQGTISDGESKALGESATILGQFGISEEVALKELKKVRGIFSRSFNSGLENPYAQKIYNDYLSSNYSGSSDSDLPPGQEIFIDANGKKAVVNVETQEVIRELN